MPDGPASRHAADRGPHLSTSPRATYRLQFNAGFGFDDAKSLVPYLSRLGISHIYASPLFRARAGSQHGYDVVDPLHLNPELGTPQQFDLLVDELRRHDMGLILDIVPNHQAASTENPWWMSVLEFGRRSPYANIFDIDWRDPSEGGALRPRLLLPILGQPYGAALDDQQIRLVLEDGTLWIRYYETTLPLAPESYRPILGLNLPALRAAVEPQHELNLRLDSIIELADALADPASGLSNARVVETAEELKRLLQTLLNASPAAHRWMVSVVEQINGNEGDSESHDLLDTLLSRQAYRLAYWRVASERINYRRFFDISDLVGLRMDDLDAFDATHELVLQLLAEDKIQGIRVDHVDGLADPSGYLQRLASRCRSVTPQRDQRNRPYLIVEKILEKDESLPADWPIDGTTGYDFLNAVAAVSIDPDGLGEMNAIYSRWTGSYDPFTEVAYREKKRAIAELFSGEMRALERRLESIAEQDRYARDLSREELGQALIETTACLGVYRTYTRQFSVSDADRRQVDQAIQHAESRNPEVSRYAFAFLRRVLHLRFPRELSDPRREMWLRFVMRWQQLTGPVMAKGVEDTAFYVYNRLLSLNDVGGEPGGVSEPVAAFHRMNELHIHSHPRTLNATSTHDTKRSEDVRARISVLSEMPRTWERALGRWGKWNQGHKHMLDGQTAPDRNEEYFIYQTLLGAWPLYDEKIPEFRERLNTYLVKALREAKVHTSWLQQDGEYEAAVLAFVRTILEPSPDNRFLPDFQRLQRRISPAGAINSLAQTVLKLTAVGVPDIYQGLELWDFSLADPDNRRPVDFTARTRALNDLDGSTSPASAQLLRRLTTNWRNGQIKLYLTQRLLHLRARYPDLFEEGEYRPVICAGDAAAQLLAYTRKHGTQWCLVAVPRLILGSPRSAGLQLDPRAWRGTTLQLGPDAPRHWHSPLSGSDLEFDPSPAGPSVALTDLWRTLPVAVLTAHGAPADATE